MSRAAKNVGHPFGRPNDREETELLGLHVLRKAQTTVHMQHCRPITNTCHANEVDAILMHSEAQNTSLNGGTQRVDHEKAQKQPKKCSVHHATAGQLHVTLFI